MEGKNERMRILVKTCGGKTIEMFVENPKMSVMGVKRLIAEKECIPAQHQRLIFVAEELDNGKTLEEVVNLKQKMGEAVEVESKEEQLEELTFHLIASAPASNASPLPVTGNGKRKRDSAADEATTSTTRISSAHALLPIPSSSSSPARKLSKKCAFVGCCKRSVVIIGDCRFCNEKFCSAHRLVEDHLCAATASCRQASFDKNATKLLREKCVAQKLQQY